MSNRTAPHRAGSRIAVGVIVCLAAPSRLPSQERPAGQPPVEIQEPAEQSQKPAAFSLWSWLKDGYLSASGRYRFEAFERDGTPFTAPAYAPTLRLTLGYQTPSFHGLSAFAQGEAVVVTGAADYSDPTLPSQNRPDRPAILDPKSLELNQAYIRWIDTSSKRKFALTVGRQEMALNDGRFLSISYWRQVHGTFDAARFDTELPQHFSFTYAFINRFYRVVGYDATDGKPSMNTHLLNLAWKKTDRMNASLYGLLLDYRAPAQFALSTQTYGLRLTGPYVLDSSWQLLYTAEFAKQKNYGSNPFRVNANYYLGELGFGWHGLGFKAGDAFLRGSSSTDKLTTPLAPPFNGWSDLFSNDPSGGGGNGLEARYLNAAVPLPFLDGATATLILYDYHSDSPRVHYGSELDFGLAYKVRRVSDRWEVGGRFARYWADRLFTDAVRASIYTSFTLR